MATAEQLATSISLEEHGVFALLWDAKEDLVRALLVLNAALSNVPKRALLLAPGLQSTAALRELIETRVAIPEPEDESVECASALPPNELWLMFLQQASYEAVGPLLNGWRRAFRQGPGTLLIARYVDFEPFQRAAPDLASFIGPRIYNASNLLSLFSDSTRKHLSVLLPADWIRILMALPGTMPSEESIRDWIAGSSIAAND
jgi:hypothetical protein